MSLAVDTKEEEWLRGLMLMLIFMKNYGTMAQDKGYYSKQDNGHI